MSPIARPIGRKNNLFAVWLLTYKPAMINKNGIVFNILGTYRGQNE